MFKRTITCIAMILSLIVPVALFLEPNNCSASESNTKAELVQISDYKLYDFYSILQMHNIAKQTGLSFSGIKHMSVPAGNYYEPHIVFVNSNDKNGKCVLGLFTNKSGVVSKITINAEYDDVKATVIENENYRQMIDTIICDNTDFVIFASYTAMMDMRHLLIESFGGDEFWQ